MVILFIPRIRIAFLSSFNILKRRSITGPCQLNIWIEDHDQDSIVKGGRKLGFCLEYERFLDVVKKKCAFVRNNKKKACVCLHIRHSACAIWECRAVAVKHISKVIDNYLENRPHFLRVSLVRNKFHLNNFLSKNITLEKRLPTGCFHNHYNLNPFDCYLSYI